MNVFKSAQRAGHVVAEQADGTRVADHLLEVDDLTLDLVIEGVRRRVLHGVSFTVGAGETLGLVGESGSGKSMTAKAVDRLLPAGAQANGTVKFEGRDVLALRGANLREYRNDVAMIFQDPRAHVNPVRSIGDFITEVLRGADGMKRSEADKLAIRMLGMVGISQPEQRLRQYPHEMSGGMLQRIMIASALLTKPKLLLADEPTTALDVTIQADVVALLQEMRRELGVGIVFITHDLELAAAICDRTAVMYAGRIVEVRDSRLLHDDPLHPYTNALARARPDIDSVQPRLHAIEGRPLSGFEAPVDACAFSDRCPHVADMCLTAQPALLELDGGLTRCCRAIELRGRMAHHG